MGFTRLVLFNYRLGNHLYYSPQRHRAESILLVLLKVTHLCSSRLLGCYLPFRARVGRDLRLPHSLHGVFISQRAVVGSAVTIYQNVTVGSDFYSTQRAKHGAPTIEDGVTIGAGAILLGKIVVGRDAVIGAGSVVTKDVPPRGTARPTPVVISSPDDPS